MQLDLVKALLQVLKETGDAQKSRRIMAVITAAEAEILRATKEAEAGIAEEGIKETPDDIE